MIRLPFILMPHCTTLQVGYGEFVNGWDGCRNHEDSCPLRLAVTQQQSVSSIPIVPHFPAGFPRIKR